MPRLLPIPVAVLIKSLALSIGCLLLASCSWLFGREGLFPDRSDEYLKTEASAPLELPDVMSEVVLNDDYPVPDLAVAQQLPEKFEVPRVEPLDTVENKGSVRIQRFNDQQWILVNAAPGQTWPLVRQFLASNDVMHIDRTEYDRVRDSYIDAKLICNIV